jgi:hypothetical protein
MSGWRVRGAAGRPFPPPRARPVTQGVVANGYALIFQKGAVRVLICGTAEPSDDSEPAAEQGDGQTTTLQLIRSFVRCVRAHRSELLGNAVVAVFRALRGAYPCRAEHGD